MASNLTISGKSISGIMPAKSCPHVNVGPVERLVSAAAGVGLTMFGMGRQSIRGTLVALLGGSLVYRGVTGNCKCYEALGIDTSDHYDRPNTALAAKTGVKVEKTIAINRSQDDLYSFWRNFENLPQFMSHIKSVTVLDGDGRRSHWVANAPLGMNVEWFAEIISDRENEMISWRSLEGSDVENAGSVHFKPAYGGRGCEVTVSLKYNPPGGKVGVALAKLFGQDAEAKIADDLRRFKQMMESGELTAIEGQGSGRRAK
jgi:uncharacterized membrane protein